MAEWKLNRMLSSVWGKLEEKRDQRKLIKYKNWCALVEKKCASTLYALKALECADTEKKEKLTMITNKLIVSVNELISLLSINAFKNDTSIMNANPTLQDSIRLTLLDFWMTLSAAVPKLEFIDVTVITQVHKVILLLMCRDEFTYEALSSSYAKEGAYKDIIVKYRSMLQTTLQIAAHRLIEKPNIPAGSLQYNGPVNTMTNISFMSKVLAILYWRLPYVGSSISQILEIPNMDLLAPVLSFPAFPESAVPGSGQSYEINSPRNANGASATTTTTTNTNSSSNSNNNSNTNNNTTNQNGMHATNPTSSTPADTSNSNANSNNTNKTNNHNTPPTNRGLALFGWATLYKDLPPLRDATFDGASVPSSTPPGQNPPPTTWLGVLAKFDTTYVTFFKEWVLHVKSVLGRVEWSTIPGFPRLLQSLLYQMRTKEQPPPPLSKPYPLLELQYLLLEQTNAELIDAFVKAAFLRTNVFELLSVLNTLHLLEGWFTELQSHDLILPATFDMTFYCSGLDILLKSDHHQTVLRVLTFVYTFAELFEHEHRMILFDLLLSKYFYILFMHWDPGVRNAYHQLLIFKMVRIKRSTLYNDGYVVKELSQVGVTSHQAKEYQTLNNSSNSLLNNRSNSGFFSSFSNVLPAFFSLSSSPDKSAPNTTDKDTAASSPSTPNSLTDHSPPKDGNNNNAQLDPKDTHNKTNTPPNNAQPIQEQSTASKSPPNSKKPIAEGASTDKPGNGLEDGFVEVPATANSGAGAHSQSNTKGNGPLNKANSKENNPAGPTTHDPSTDVDVKLFLQLNSYLKSIEDQLRKTAAKKVFEGRLEPYAPYALAEFNQHLARYHQWELKNEEPPRFMSLPFARMGEG